MSDDQAHHGSQTLSGLEAPRATAATAEGPYLGEPPEAHADPQILAAVPNAEAPGPFIVIENTPGYLPDSDGDPPIFPTFEEAEAHALELVRYLAEEALDADDSFSSNRETPTLWRISYTGVNPPSLDRVIEIWPAPLQDNDGAF